MSGEVAKALANPDLKQKMEAARITPLAMSPNDFTALIKAGIVRWGKVIGDAKITTE